MSFPFERGKSINEGKTKRIYEVLGTPGFAIVESKDTITRFNTKVAKDTAEMLGKGALANRRTCNIFRLLHTYNVPVAYIGRIDDSS